MNEFGVVILAAGASSRMGSAKQLLKFRGLTFLEQAMETASQVFGKNICIVLGANASLIMQAVPKAQQYAVINENWEQGMGTSIARGLESIRLNVPGISGVMYMTVDQPFVTNEHLQEMVRFSKESGKAIIASQYKETAGIPAIFNSDFFEELLALKADKGAKEIIQRNAARVGLISLPAGDLDIDTPEQYAVLNGPASDSRLITNDEAES